MDVIINSTREDQGILQASSQHSLSQGGALVVTPLLIMDLICPNKMLSIKHREYGNISYTIIIATVYWIPAIYSSILGTFQALYF